MALNIEGASVGYDENSMNSTLNHVHNDCVVSAKNALRQNLSTLRDAVHACWVGQSANNFMDNMDKDVEEICKGLDAAYEGLEAEFKKVLAGLSEIDQNLIEKR